MHKILMPHVLNVCEFSLDKYDHCKLYLISLMSANFSE